MTVIIVVSFMGAGHFKGESLPIEFIGADDDVISVEFARRNSGEG